MSAVTTPTPVEKVTLGNIMTFSTTVRVRDPATGNLSTQDDPGLKLYVRGPDGMEDIYDAATSPAVTHIAPAGSGRYYLSLPPGKLGLWSWRWLGDAAAQGASEGAFEVVSAYVPPAPLDLTDLRVLVPRARRYIEGPYGSPENRPPLDDEQIYAMVADATADAILYSGNLFGHQLIVKARDPIAGFPTAWQTDVMLTEWENSVITAQTALNYFFFLFRDMKVSQSIKNEGTEWQYALSANVIRDYIGELQQRRDLALAGLQKHHPTLDRYASNIRVRDQATVAVLEWWDTNSPNLSGGAGMPGGQEAAVIPWTPGWSGAGFTP